MAKYLYKKRDCLRNYETASFTFSCSLYGVLRKDYIELEVIEMVD